MRPFYLILLHHPVTNKRGEVVTSAVTSMDIHDLARIGRTYGTSGVFIATPIAALRRLAEKILDHWSRGFGAEYNETRKDALSLVRTVADLDTALLEIERECGDMPLLVATSARSGAGRTSFPEMAETLRMPGPPVLLLLGTGWGLAQEVMDRVDVVLEPIRGVGDYNHLPVRGATAILLDRLIAREPG